jgi:hypothetical protein
MTSLMFIGSQRCSPDPVETDAVQIRETQGRTLEGPERTAND